LLDRGRGRLLVTSLGITSVSLVDLSTSELVVLPDERARREAEVC
jgi:hypothetical protein